MGGYALLREIGPVPINLPSSKRFIFSLSALDFERHKVMRDTPANIFGLSVVLEGSARTRLHLRGPDLGRLELVAATPCPGAFARPWLTGQETLSVHACANWQIVALAGILSLDMWTAATASTFPSPILTPLRLPRSGRRPQGNSSEHVRSSR